MEKCFPVTPIQYHLCPKECMLFPNDDDDKCKVCGTMRYDDNGTPLSVMTYLPLKDQLALLLARSESRKKLGRLSERHHTTN
ncbi:hypothetical protein BJV82DRAFT_634457, partial [Fennellomyces sp. T-0311]